MPFCIGKLKTCFRVNVYVNCIKVSLLTYNMIIEYAGLLIQASRSIQYDGKLPKEQLAKGVICSSAGNHAQGVALSAKTLGCDAVIWESVKRLGATVVLEGDSYDEAQAYAKRRGESENRTFIPPFDHPDIITGQGLLEWRLCAKCKVQFTLYLCLLVVVV
ncbi:putative threonine ammonia-lyase [Helianthus annuus]|nr:putative threonine ammonia-lyase [Helianthus annuus]